MAKLYVKSYKKIEDAESDNPYIRFKDVYDLIIEKRYFFGFYTEEITERIVLQKGYDMKKFKPGTLIN